MFEFEVFYDKNDIYLNGKKKYASNQILVELFNTRATWVTEMKPTLELCMKKIIIHKEMSQENLEDFPKIATATETLISQLDKQFQKLPVAKLTPPMDKFLPTKLATILNQLPIWENGDFQNDPEYLKNQYMYQNIYGKAEYDQENGQFFIQIQNFHPIMSLIQNQKYEKLEQINEEVRKLLGRYLKFLEDFLRVKNVYSYLVNDCLNSENKYLSSAVLAQKFIEFQEKYNRPEAPPEECLLPGMASFSLEAVGGTSKALCKVYQFDSLGSFLYFDFFNGLEWNFIPKLCKNCGKYFLIKGGKYNSYCDNPSPQDNTKSCREVGASASFQDKCKTDPIWQAYNRAYKTHYARYKKNKMSKDEFETWTSWATEMRGKMQNEEMEFEDFVARIKV
ncbi:MAG: DUF6076 domain-containing protein [Eubacteriales bacterium]